MALIAAGLVLEIFREYNHGHGERMLQGLVRRNDGTFVSPPDRPQIPHLYGVRPRKPG